MKKLIIAAAVLALAASSLSAVPANAAAVSAAKARVGTECASVGATAVKRGADGSNLKCMVVKTGGHKGKKMWWYPTLPKLSKLEFTIAASLTGGYGGMGLAVADALKAEGLVSNPTRVANSGASGTKGLSEFIRTKAGKTDSALVTGLAMLGGVYTNAATNKFRVSDAVPVARMQAETEAIAVLASSPIKNLADLVTAIKANPKAVPLSGGPLGTVDHYTAALMFDAIGVEVKNMNWVDYSGGTEVTASLLKGDSVAGISGWGELAPFVAAGKIRVIGISSGTRISGVFESPRVAAKTMKEQGVNVNLTNWRGILLPTGTSTAHKNLVIRALDIVNASKSWAASVKKNSWTNVWLPGAGFEQFVRTEERKIATVYAGLGL